MPLFKVEKQIPSNLLKDRFIIPPFSVFNTQAGYWQERKNNWIGLGIQSELGRAEHLTYAINVEQYGRKVQQTSTFDPVICELSYKWFTKEGDSVLDPFAGGAVRGMVAGILGRHYTGIDLSGDQLIENRKQYNDISSNYDNDIIEPIWIEGNSENIKELVGTDKKYDFILSCPPYYDLEVYSQDEADLSYKDTYEDFLVSYAKIIKESIDLLKDDTFIVWVVGNGRNKKTQAYYNIVGDTINIFKDCDCLFYNEAIIMNTTGTLSVRVGKQFNNSRKFGKQHQNYLVFYKGNPNNINKKFGDFEEEKKV